MISQRRMSVIPNGSTSGCTYESWTSAGTMGIHDPTNTNWSAWITLHHCISERNALVAELVDALVSGTSG